MKADEKYILEIIELSQELMRVIEDSTINPVHRVIVLNNVRNQYVCDHFDGEMIDEYGKLTEN